MVVSGVAGRYASALFDLAQETKTVDTVGEALQAFDAMIAESPDLARLVRSPVFSSEEQVAAISAILDKTKIDGIAANFLKLVAEHRRLFVVRDMIRAYKGLSDAAKGISRAQVTLAEAPSDKLLSEIGDALTSVAGKKIDLDVKIDPAIIGGIVVKLGSRMVDASLKTKLNGIRIAMKEVG